MTTIRVKEPESGLIKDLRIQEVKNFAFPSWVVLIPDQTNVLLYREGGQWHTIPEGISAAYTQRIGNKITLLAL